MRASPRAEEAASGGTTSLNYQTNGEQWYARQDVWTADTNWGARIGYGHRTGSDYRDGSGGETPSSYKSRNFDVSFGVDLQPGESLKLFALHQDQTDVELAGQAFDLDLLQTDAVELTWSSAATSWTDHVEVEVWYNETHLSPDYS
ncbi:MAG: hypothetical protein O2820_24530 [Planctomycetota bacterium]|nr:hypothetical protein [Planctomycetota bacterium]MDA1252381.1 hypothetical protein [Planctomycetota bacterium]